MIQPDLETRLRFTLKAWDEVLEDEHVEWRRRTEAGDIDRPPGVSLLRESEPAADRRVDVHSVGRRHAIDLKVVALVACVLVFIGVGFGIASQRGRTVEGPPIGITPTTVPLATVLEHAEQGVGEVHRSAIKTMPLGTIQQALRAVGLGVGPIDDQGVPLPAWRQVDVVALAGDLRPLGATSSYPWVIVIVDPTTGQVLSASAGSSGGTWPAFFDGLPG